MAVVFIVPTGLGARIGGHAGDATPALRVIAQASSGPVLTHPNVVNASAINEMPSSTWYIEGSMLDRFLEGDIQLASPRANRVLVAVNPPVSNYAINAVSAARATIGLDAYVLVLREPLRMKGWVNEDGIAKGEVFGLDKLINQVKQHEYDALAILTEIDVSPAETMQYFQNGGTNPWGGIEAEVSRKISAAINKPVAHAPLESQTTIDTPELLDIAYTQRIDPRQSAEACSANYAHCVLKGLYRAPRIGDELSLRDVTCLISPFGCVGRPHWACFVADIPVVAVVGNPTVCAQDDSRLIRAANYLEAAGIVAQLEAGVSREAVLGIKPTVVYA